MMLLATCALAAPIPAAEPLNVSSSHVRPVFAANTTNSPFAAAVARHEADYADDGRRLSSFFNRGGRGGGRGRGFGRGRGAGRSGATTEDGAPNIPTTRAPADERVCFPVPPDGTVTKQGQVQVGTSFGAALSAIASLPNVKRVLELGTWYGGGSTVNLGQGIRDSVRATLAQSLGASAPTDNCVTQPSATGGGMERCCHSLVVTVEVFEPAWSHARKYLRDLPVWCVRGSTVAAEEMLQVSDIPQRLRDAHFRLYYQRDLNLMKRSVPQLHKFCTAYQFDLVLIDGNEYTGWAEFIRAKNECKPMYLALHDTQTLKTEKIEKYLATHTDEYQIFLRKYQTQSMRPACELVGCKREESFLPNSAGWSVYKRVDSAGTRRLDQATSSSSEGEGVGGSSSSSSSSSSTKAMAKVDRRLRRRASVTAREEGNGLDWIRQKLRIGK